MSFAYLFDTKKEMKNLYYKNNKKNEFTKKIKDLFLSNKFCFYCDKYGFDTLHHIMGVSNKKVCNSPLNACPIHNNECHLSNLCLRDDNVRMRLLKKTYEFLMINGYNLTKKDKNFIRSYSRFYKRFY